LFRSTNNTCKTSHTTDRILVSVAIPAYNEQDCIGDCLRSIARQRTSAKVEAIVCLNACTDHTAHAAIKVAEEEGLDLKLVDEPLKGIARARQRAFEEAGGDIIVSADADSLYPTDWIERIVAAFDRKQQTALVYGPVYFTRIRGFTGTVMHHAYPVIDFVITQFDRLTKHPNVRGPNFAVAREAFKQVKGFNVDLEAFEDNDLAWRVAKLRGHRALHYDRHLVVHSSARRYNYYGLWKAVHYYTVGYFKTFLLKKGMGKFQDVRISP